jgi:UDP-2,3-diacylglucosamine pyrophosphatase LpxH
MNLVKITKHKYVNSKLLYLITLLSVIIITASISFAFSDDTFSITGKVFLDENRNGKADNDEPGMPDVLITDGRKLIRTDEEGLFSFQSENAKFVWISLVPDFKTAESYFYLIESQRKNYDFPVVRENYQADVEKTLIFMADLHLIDKVFVKENLQKITSRVNQFTPEAIFLLGDLIDEGYKSTQAEAEKKFSLVNSFRDKLAASSYCVVGNNDPFGWYIPELDEKTSPLYGKKMFEHYIGPRYYSVNVAGFHFIILDDVQGKQVKNIRQYFGWIDEPQLKWLQEDLKNVPYDNHIVILTHIPLVTSSYSFIGVINKTIIEKSLDYQGRNASSLFVANFDQIAELLKPYNKITFAAGHLHLFEKGSFEGMSRRISYFICGYVSIEYWKGNIKSLQYLPTSFSPGMMVVTCKNRDFTNVKYETFDFYNIPTNNFDK